MVPISLFLGNRVAMRVYPGKKRRNGSPKTMRRASTSANEMIRIKTSEQRFTIRSSFWILILVNLCTPVAYPRCRHQRSRHRGGFVFSSPLHDTASLEQHPRHQAILAGCSHNLLTNRLQPDDQGFVPCVQDTSSRGSCHHCCPVRAAMSIHTRNDSMTSILAQRHADSLVEAAVLLVSGTHPVLPTSPRRWPTLDL
jgi:hypothetical protein